MFQILDSYDKKGIKLQYNFFFQYDRVRVRVFFWGDLIDNPVLYSSVD